MAITNKINEVSGEDAKNFLSRNQIWLAALAGAAAGIVIASLVSSDKGKAFLSNVGDSAGKLAEQVKANLVKEKIAETFNKITSKVREEVPTEV